MLRSPAVCGILGVRRSWQPAREHVERALATLAWRGPDGRRLEAHGDWWLGVARLTITDPEVGQPLRCPRTGRVVVFNGAVTSAKREWAGAAGVSSRNDAELALSRFEQGGAAALSATCGPYALAIVDPHRDDVWLARDPEGEKPLWVVCRDGAVVAFASTVTALRALGVQLELPAVEVARLLRFGFCCGPQAGGGFELRGDLHGVWGDEAGAGLRQVAGAPAPESEARGSLRERVLHAVDRCRGAEVPVALALSGGVDSACLAAALRQLDLTCPAYQFRAVGASGEERQRAAMVAAHTRIELRAVDGGPEVSEALPALTQAAGLPQGDPSVLAAHALARAAASDGVRVLLSGEGADEQWLGYRRHRAARFLPRRGLRFLPAPTLAAGTVPRLLRALRAPVPYDELLAVTPAAFLERVLEPGVLPPAALPGANAVEPALLRARDVDRRFYLRFDLLPKLDVATMAAGVEGRCPYLDPEVLHSAESRTTSPATVLGKRHLKRAFAADLPNGLLHRRKLGFGLPLDAWLRGDGLLPDLLHDRRTLERPHLRRDGLRDMVARHRAGRARFGHPLYLIAALELYLRTVEANA